MEHLRASNEIALSRTLHWQAFCVNGKKDIFSFLIELAIKLDEAIAPVLLQV